MREGGSEAFRIDCNRAVSPVIPFVELLRTDAEAVVDTNTEWGQADSLTGILRRNGQIVLTGSTNTYVAHATGTDETLDEDLMRNPVGATALGVAAVQWNSPADVQDREIHAVTARLDPASGGAQNVARWHMRLFRLYSVERDGERSVATRWHLQPKGSTVSVAAGAIQADVTFELPSPTTVGEAPIVDPETDLAPAGSAPDVPTTVIVIWGVQADGSPATNVAWVTDDADDEKTISGQTVSRFDLDEPTAGSYAGLAFRNTGPSNGVPRFSLVGRSYSPVTVTFSSSPVDLGSAPDSASRLELVGQGRARGGSILYEINDGVSGWLPYVDGDEVGVDLSGDGGSDLSSLARQQTYDMRVTLTPATVGASPIVSRIGVREIGASEYVTDQVIIDGVTWAVDPLTGASEVPEAEVSFIVDGRRDYRSLIEDTLATYHVGALQLRIWMGDPRRHPSNWLHIDDFLVDDYQANDGVVKLTCVSPLSLIKREIPEATGSNIQALTYLSDTPADIYDDLLANQLGVPDRYIGQGVTATTPTLSREIIERIQGRDAIEHVARIGGAAIISSQGKLKAVPFYGSDPQEDDALTLFTREETRVVGFAPGYRTRVTSAVVKYGWDEAAGAFSGSRRSENVDAINNLGRGAIDFEEQIEDELSKWFEGGTDAGGLSTEYVELFGPGMKLVRVQSAVRRPWLEPGTPVAVESDLFIGRDPVSGVSVRGPMIAYGVIQAANGVEGRDFTVWIRSWEDIVPDESDQGVIGFRRPEISDFTYSFDTSGDLIVTIRATEAEAVRVAASDSAFPTEATVNGTSLTALSSDGWAEINLGGGFGSEVFLAARATELATGAGAVSAYTVSKTFKVEYIEAEGGTVGGWEIDDDEIKAVSGGFTLNSSTRRLLIGAATAVLTGVGIFAGDVGDGTYDLRAGDPAGDYFHWDESAGSLFISGEIEATSGVIGGWEITATDIVSPSGNLRLESDTERILLGAATAPLVGDGGFFGESGGVTQLRIGDPGGDYLLYDGSALVLSGQIVDSGNIVDGAVTSAKIDDAAVTTAKLFDEAVTSAKLGDSAVTTVKINDEAITEGKTALGVLESRLIWGWQGSQAFPTSTTIAGANEHTFDSPGSGRAVVRVLLLDAEGAGQVALNGTQIGTNLSGPDNTSKWYVLVTDGLVEGENTLAFWSTTTDGITLQGIEVYASTAGLADTTENVRGLITADLILAGTITANEIEAASITGDRLTAATITGDLVAANTLAARNLFVGSFDNLVRNPGFEQSGSALSEWSNAGGGGTWSVSATGPRSGDRHAVFDPSGQTGDARLQNSTQTAGTNTDGIAVTTGDQLYVEAYVRAASAGAANDARVIIMWRDSAGVFISSASSSAVTPTTSFQAMTVTGTAPSGAAQAIIELRVDNDGNSNLLRFDDVYARRKVTGSIVVDGTLTAVQVSAMDLTGKTLVGDTGSIGGWVLSAGTLSSGDVTIDAANERITMGAASAPMTGVGIFIGEDGAGGYDLRAGDPSGDYLHWDASAGTLEIAGLITADAVVAAGTFTATSPVFDGTLSVQAGDGANRLTVDSTSGGGRVRLFDSGGGVGIISHLTNLTLSSSGAINLQTTGSGATSIFTDLNVSGDTEISGAVYVQVDDVVSPSTFARVGGVFHKDMSVRSVSGTTVTDLETITVPDGTLVSADNGSGIRLTAWGEITGLSDSKWINVVWGGTEVFDQIITGAQRGFWDLVVDIHYLTATTQRANFRLTYSNGTVGRTESYSTTTADSTSNNLDLVVQGQRLNAGDGFDLTGTVLEYLP